MSKNLRRSETKPLVRRYLIWCYKTTKEELDWIDRKFTQLEVDRFILKELQKNSSKHPPDRKFIDEFLEYISAKEKKATKAKFVNSKGQTITPKYRYLKNRLSAIEKAIQSFLNKSELDKIRSLYEEEMTQRILQAREH